MFGIVHGSSGSLKPDPIPSGYGARRGLSPVALGGVVVVHVGLAALLMTLHGATTFTDPFKSFIVRAYPADPPPPPVDQPVARQHARPHDPIVAPKPRTLLPTTQDDIPVYHIAPPPTDGGPGLDTGPDIRPTMDPPPPVLVAPRADPRFAGTFQPDYPAAMLRLQKEGDVTVRALIGADGRVRDLILIGTPDPAFFEATRRQALKAWRFLPATRDGVPVASEKVMTVHFRLTE